MKPIKTKADRYAWVGIFFIAVFFLVLQHYEEKQSDGLFWVLIVVAVLSFVQTIVLSLPDEPSVNYINEHIEAGIIEPGLISDGYHTFDELYEHRIELYIELCRHLAKNHRNVWRSQRHSDCTVINGWFLLGINKSDGHQITYHLPNERWDDVDFAETLQKAPKFDGHTPEDVLERLKKQFHYV